MHLHHMPYQSAQRAQYLPPSKQVLVSDCVGLLLYFETMIDIYFAIDGPGSPGAVKRPQRFP